jgi:putative copper export protein
VSFLVRWLHVMSVAFVFGGALLIFLFLHCTSNNRDVSSRRMLFDLMRAFEWGSWASLGVVVATGVGNLGHFGESLPDSRSQWGRELTVKLGLVLVFLLFSAFRTLAVTTAANQPDDVALSRRTQRNLGGLYGITAAFVVSIAGVAIALAHF